MSMYVPEDLQFLRVYKCFNQVGRDLMLMVFKWGFTLTQNETLKSYLYTKNNFNNTTYKRRYDEDQKKKIDAYDVHNGLKFDVTVLFRLIQDTNNYLAPSKDNSIWTTPSPTQLEYLFHKIKKNRNDLTHTPVSLDDTSAHQIIQECKDLFLDFIEAVGIRYGRDVATEKANLNKDIDELLNHRLSENEIQRLFTEQRHERSMDKMLTEGVPEMKTKYIKKSDLNPLTLIDGSYFRLPVMKVYKELEIRDCGRNSKNMLIDNNDILRLNHSWETVTDLNESVDLVILEGPTGSGKTTITKKLLAEWSTNPNSPIKGLMDYSVLIYMECRTTTESLKNLLHSLMPKSFLTLKEEPEKTLSDCAVLIVIDSLDELNDNSETLFKELLELIKMENVTGICTVRPTKTKDVFALLPSELKRVHLKSRGIPDGQRGSFVEMYHAELRKQGMSQQSTEQLVQQINKSSSLLQGHLRYPINLVHIAYLWAIAPEKVKCVATATELYTNIHEVVQIKLFSGRLISNSRTKGLTEEECGKKVKKFLEALYTEAMLNLTRQQFCILPKDSETELKKVCKENDLPQCEILSAFLVTKSLYSGITAETEFSISHTNMQEYLAACCIFNAVKNKSVQKLKRRISNVNQNGVTNVSTVRRIFNNVNINFLSNDPVSDVLEIFFPNTDIQYEDYQNVFKHLTGLFVLNDETMSTKVAKDLVELLKKSRMLPEDWLNIYAEAKSDKCIVKYLRRLCSDMLSGDINVRDSHLAAYAILLDPQPSKSCKRDVVDSASAVKANSLNIKLENPPSEHPDLRYLMFHAMKLSCNVELHICSNWRNPKPGVIKDILDINQKSSNIKVMRGSPSSSELHVMASKLERLYISICDDEHARDILNIFKTEKFPKLTAIYFHMKCGNVSSEALQPLSFCRTPKIFLFLSDVDDNNVAWAGKVAKALQLPNGEYDCLYLPNNQLTSSGFVNIVNELHQNNVKILVRIGVTSDLVDEKQDEPLEPLKAANAESWNKFRCDVLWYFSAERMEGW